jgi:TPR repeat protein
MKIRPVAHLFFTFLLLQSTSELTFAGGKKGERNVNEEGKRTRKEKKKSDEKQERKQLKTESFSALGKKSSSSSKFVPLQESPDPLHDLINRTKEVKPVYEGTLEVWDEELDDLVEQARSGNAKAAGKIGSACYAISRQSLDIYLTQANLLDNDDVNDLAFAWLAHAHANGDTSISIELGYCYLLEIGRIFSDPIEALKLFKANPVTMSLDDPQRKLKRRLLLAHSGFDRFIECDEEKDKELIEYLNQAPQDANLVTQCMIANRQSRSAEAAKGFNALKELAKTRNPLPQWLLARAHLSGRGTKQNVELGIALALEAADNKSAKAMIFMNHSFPLKHKVPSSDGHFPRCVKKAHDYFSIFSRRGYLFDENPILVKFNEDLSTFLNGMRAAASGLWISCLGINPKVNKALTQRIEYDTIYLNGNTITWGKENVVLARAFDKFLGEIDQKFADVFGIIDAAIQELETKEREKREESLKAEPPKKGERNQKHIIEYEAKQINKKINKIKDTHSNLKLLLTALKELKEATQADRDGLFLGTHPFFNVAE